jgi:hypothetical protein
MQLRLGEDIHGVMIDGDAVFLDVKGDRWVCPVDFGTRPGGRPV